MLVHDTSNIQFNDSFRGPHSLFYISTRRYIWFRATAYHITINRTAFICFVFVTIHGDPIVLIEVYHLQSRIKVQVKAADRLALTKVLSHAFAKQALICCYHDKRNLIYGYLIVLSADKSTTFSN